MHDSTVKLYIMPISEAEKIPQEYCLNHFPKRYEKSTHFKSTNDKLRSIGAGALISKVLNIDEKDIFFNTDGKPLSNKTTVKFNLSHSGNYIILATANNDVGTDIEALGRYNESIAKKILTNEELKYVSDDLDNRFTTIWTLKEAVSKAIGIGIRISFSSLNVLPLLNDNCIEYNKFQLFAKTITLDDYCISVCCAKRISDIEVNNFIWND